MTEVTETFRHIAAVGDLKFISIQGDSTTESSFTIDLDSDATDGRGTVMQEILNTLLQDDAGRDETGTFDPATGIYTLGTINATGIHNLFIIGR